MPWKIAYDWREPRYLLEIVAVLCGLPLAIAYRLEASPSVSPGETVAWMLALWGLGSALRTFRRSSRDVDQPSLRRR